MDLPKKRIANSGNPCYNPECVRSKDDAPTLGCRQAVRHQTLTLTFVGSNPAIPAKFIHIIMYDPLAQSAEQLPFKQWVRSSNLRRVTKKADTPVGCLLFYFRRRFESRIQQPSGLLIDAGLTASTQLFSPWAKMQTNSGGSPKKQIPQWGVCFFISAGDSKIKSNSPAQIRRGIFCATIGTASTVLAFLF